MRADPSNPLPRDPSTTRTDSGPMDEGKMARHPVSGRYVTGPSLPDMPANHDVTVFDLSSGAQQERLTHPRPGANTPNGMPPAGDVAPAVNILNMDDISGLSQ